MSEGSINFTVKELLAMLEKTLTEQISHIAVRIEEVNRKLDLKASEARVEAVEQRVSESEKRIAQLEIYSASSRALVSANKWLVGAVAVPLIGVIATLVWLAAGGH